MMKVFLSWSGIRSRAVAEALREWLPDVIQGMDPWMSKIDIEAGARWRSDVAAELESAMFGILCLTQGNQTAPWILFEAGALAKTIPDTFLCPYLIDFPPAELQPGPLTEFQAKQATELETWEMLTSINRAQKENALTETRLRKSFDKFWPDLAQKLKNLPAEPTVSPRKMDEMVEEILEIVRAISRRESSAAALGQVPEELRVTKGLFANLHSLSHQTPLFVVEGDQDRLSLERTLQRMLKKYEVGDNATSEGEDG